MRIYLLRFVFCCACFAPFAATAQQDRIAQMETEVIAASGVTRIEKLLALVDFCISQGQYDKANTWIEEAEDFSKRLRRPDLRAIALNREGKVMVLTGKRKAAARFKQSNELLRDAGGHNKTLALDNLEYMRQLALKNGDADDVAKVEEQIAWLKGVHAPIAPVLPGGSSAALPPPTAGVTTPLTKQELKQELSAIQNEFRNANQNYQQEQIKLLRESKELQAQLAQKEAALDSMSETQMKTAMLLLQQRYLLDSLGYRSQLDSLAIVNWNLALSESETNRKIYLIGMLVLLLLSGGAIFSYLRARQYSKSLEDKNKIIREEQHRSESLLLNILPALVAEELKAKGHTDARPFEDVSVLFADFVGFSKIAEKLTPQQLVSDLDACFQAFDNIVAKYGLEKIKTIGDAYMCAGGLPNGGGSKAREIIQAARDMQDWLNRWNAEREPKGLPRYDARIGVHCGPVVAGVVGSKKFAFDIWGDTVNIAARIEQAGEGGRINISGNTFQIIREYFPCRYRGKIAVKNKGEIDMYFVEN